MRIRILPYKQGSKSAKLLAETMGGKRIKLVGSRFRKREGDVVINWGNSQGYRYFDGVLNAMPGIAQNKLESFKRMKDEGVRVPEFWIRKDDVPENTKVVCRTVLNGHSGDGVVVSPSRADLVDAPLYTQYIKKEQEYRVHVMGDRAFFVQRKARKRDVENPNWEVRNLANGFVFVMQSLDDLQVQVVEQSIKAIKALGLDFGAVDVILGKDGKAYVLEVNTACGLEPRTAEFYKQAFEEYLDEV